VRQTERGLRRAARSSPFDTELVPRTWLAVGRCPVGRALAIDVARGDGLSLSLIGYSPLLADVPAAAERQVPPLTVPSF